jgi:hypothetical protein
MDRSTRWKNEVGKIVNTEKEMTAAEVAEQPILELSATTQLSDYIRCLF